MLGCLGPRVLCSDCAVGDATGACSSAQALEHVPHTASKAQILVPVGSGLQQRVTQQTLTPACRQHRVSCPRRGAEEVLPASALEILHFNEPHKRHVARGPFLAPLLASEQSSMCAQEPRVLKEQRAKYTRMIPELYDRPDSERSESEKAALRQ
eukprot:scaffold193872_cov17-Tisochrysis_lutea.AAC.1